MFEILFQLSVKAGSEVAADNVHIGRQLNADPDYHHDQNEQGFSLEGLDRLMGISLVLGFVFMMFVEQIATYMSSNTGNRVITTDAESLVQSSGTMYLLRHVDCRFSLIFRKIFPIIDYNHY